MDVRAEKLTVDEIWYMDAGVFTTGDDDLRALVSRAYSRIPAEAVEQVMDECLMFMPLGKEKGCFLPKEFIEDKGLIVLPEALLDEEAKEIDRIILHETAHFILKHKSPMSLDYNIQKQQEQEADKLVEQWLKQ